MLPYAGICVGTPARSVILCGHLCLATCISIENPILLYCECFDVLNSDRHCFQVKTGIFSNLGVWGANHSLDPHSDRSISLRPRAGSRQVVSICSIPAAFGCSTSGMWPMLILWPPSTCTSITPDADERYTTSTGTALYASAPYTTSTDGKPQNE